MYVEIEYPEFNFFDDLKVAYASLHGTRFKDELGTNAEHLRNELLVHFLRSQLESPNPDYVTVFTMDHSRPSPHLLEVCAFLALFGRDVRDVICRGKVTACAGRFTEWGLSPGMAGLAALVVQKLGYPEPVAIGLATCMFAVLAETPREAFCEDCRREEWACARPRP